VGILQVEKGETISYSIHSFPGIAGRSSLDDDDAVLYSSDLIFVVPFVVPKGLLTISGLHKLWR